MSTNTTAWAWRNLSLYGGNEGDSTKLIIAYEAPESVKEEMAAEGGPLDQKAIGRDALAVSYTHLPSAARTTGPCPATARCSITSDCFGNPASVRL